MTTLLRDVLHDELDTIAVPQGDLAGVRRRGRRRRGARWAAAGGAGVLAAGLVVGLTQLGGSAPGDRGIEPIGQLDFSHGLRAYADPGGEIHLGGRALPADRLDDLDVAGAATPYGVVFYAHGVPSLLDESGEITALEPAGSRGGYLPTPMVDSSQPLVAYGATIEGRPHIVVHDFEHPEDPVAIKAVPADTEISAIDGGVVVFRTPAGSQAWDARGGDLADLAGPKTRVADVRNGVLLYDGPAPDGPAAAAYRLVPGAIDAQLTFDGGHVLYWSNKLESTDGSAPIVLDQEATFFTVDTDGSILAAAPARGGGAEVYDCEIPSGRCEDLGHLPLTGGDPMFMGNDM